MWDMVLVRLAAVRLASSVDQWDGNSGSADLSATSSSADGADAHVHAVFEAGRVARGLRRAFDIAMASLALIIAAIPMAIIAVLVVATSRGKVLFSQSRAGRGGQPIQVLKFRSMCEGAQDLLDADEDLRAAYIANDFKLPGDTDPRITPVGRFLRKTSLDELPQLWNVIRGDMSMVGVRPLLHDELAGRPEYDQALYCLLRPGLTGLWQVRGRSSVDQVNRMGLDREYIENWSPWNDAKILALTPLAVLRIHHTH